MTLASMTGFARTAGEHAGWRWAWELRSVNGRGLDLRIRVPSGFDGVEITARAEAGARLARGSVTAGLTVERGQTAPPAVRINEALLEALIAVAARHADREDVAPPRLDGLLAVPGVIEPIGVAPDEAARADLESALIAGFREALAALAVARAAEGARLAAVLAARVEEIAALTAEAEASPARAPDAIARRLAQQVAALTGLADFDPQRLHQEAALIAVKADIREELDRLTAHVAQARTLLAAGEPVGRRLEFLAQEFNREANTLCSKAADPGLGAIGLRLKAAADQFREQVANIE
jgi:uncharacterized protein (TIGR00255 family)